MTANRSATVELLHGFSRFFYLTSPQETSFPTINDVPNLYRQSWPYFLFFMLMEHCILRIEGKKGIRINDGVTSISNGLFQECGRLLWRGGESALYSWVYSHFRLCELPWDSPPVWYAAALGVDFCYYWVHRACHEVHILWAQHQVHHSSEDYNVAVGLRQSVLQGWCAFIFYLPLALIVPPSHFVMHQQFSLLYQFWIHTETINHLGPLEYILNTPRHHRVHHGSNKYCLDTNYGGVLIIWDRIFGTFAEEKDKEEIVYGLVFNQPSFNPLHLQTFYTTYVVQKFKSLTGWRLKLAAIFYGPSWAPGTPRLGYEKDKIDVTSREKFDVPLPNWYNAYLLVHFAVVLYSFHELALNYMGMNPISVLAFVFYIIGSLTLIGMLFENRRSAQVMEVGRCSILAFLARHAAVAGGVASPSLLLLALQLFYVASAVCWALYCLRLVQIAHGKQSIQ